MEKEEIIINDSSVGFVGNPLKSQAVDKILTVSDLIYDTELSARQNIINLDFDDRIKGLENGTAGGTITEEQLENIKTQITEEVTTNVQSYADLSFLSKVNEDTAAEHIIFQKGITIGSFESGISGADITTEGNAEFRNIECDNAELSDTLIVNNIQSTDWSSEEKIGFNITTDEGKSYIEVDKLYVRLKAIFEELELRKLTHVGGNLTLSPANSTISHVEPLYNTEDQSIYAYRCYFLKDDGDTRVYNNWLIGDMAKCQTFNLESVANYTSTAITQDGQILSLDGSVIGYTTKEYVNVSNRYYWRAVVGVGESVIEGEADERIYNYVDLSNESVITLSGNVNGLQGMDSSFESETDRMENDIPAKGDVIVQEGNLIDSERLNIIKLDTIGQNAPSMILYVGVGSNSDNPYVLSKHIKVQIAGGGENKLIVNSLEIATENNTTYKIPVDKGAYIENTTYNYYDRVSYNGSIWLCINKDGSNGTIPSAETSEYWLEQVAKGDLGIQGEQGIQGPKGNDGTSVNIKGSVTTGSDLASIENPTEGDGYIAEDTGHLWVYDGTLWVDAGEIKGPLGDPGPAGVDGVDGADGEDAVNIVLTPSSIILTQDPETNEIDFTNSISYIKLYKGSEEIETGYSIDSIIIDGGSSENTVEAGALGENAIIIDGVVDKPTSGKIEVSVNYEDKVYNSVLQYAINWNGIWSATIKNDVYKAVASKTFSYYDENEELITVNGISTLELSAEGLTSRVEEVESTLTTQAESISAIKQTSTSLSSRISSVEDRQDTQDTNISTIEQNVDSVALTVDSHQTSIDSNTENIAQLIVDKNGIESRVSSIEDRQDIQDGYISTIEQTSSALSTRVTSVENGVALNSSSIQLNADLIDLTVQGLTNTGINIEDGIITLNADNTIFEGNVTFNGVIVENMKDYPDLTTGSYSGFVPIDMENNCSLSLANGYLVTLPILKNTFTPTGDDNNIYSIMAGGARYKNNEDQYEFNKNGYVPVEYSTPGTKLTITNKYSSAVGGWRYIQNQQTWRSYAGSEYGKDNYNTDLSALLESAVMVVSDARLFNGEHDSIGLVITGGFPNDIAILEDDDDVTERWSNIFCCGGMIGRIILLLPGQTLKLTSSLVTIGSKERLIWNVDNPEEFTAIRKTVGIDTSWVDGIAEGRVYTSGDILQINTTSIGMETTGSGQDANASIFGPKILCDSVSEMDDYRIAITLTETNGEVHPKYSVEYINI